MNRAIVLLGAAVVCTGIAFRAALPHAVIPVLVLAAAKWAGVV